MISNNDSQMIDVVDNSVAHLLFCDVEINGLSGCVRRRIRRWTTQSSAAGVSGGRGRSITVDVGGHSSRRRRACASAQSQRRRIRRWTSQSSAESVDVGHGRGVAVVVNKLTLYFCK